MIRIDAYDHHDADAYEFQTPVGDLDDPDS